MPNSITIWEKYFIRLTRHIYSSWTECKERIIISQITLLLYATINRAALFTDIPITVYSLRKIWPTTPQYVIPEVTATVTDFTLFIARRCSRTLLAHLNPICDSSTCLSPRSPNMQRNVRSLSKRDVLFTHPCISLIILKKLKSIGNWAIKVIL